MMLYDLVACTRVMGGDHHARVARGWGGGVIPGVARGRLLDSVRSNYYKLIVYILT